MRFQLSDKPSFLDQPYRYNVERSSGAISLRNLCFLIRCVQQVTDNEWVTSNSRLIRPLQLIEQSPEKLSAIAYLLTDVQSGVGRKDECLLVLDYNYGDVFQEDSLATDRNPLDKIIAPDNFVSEN